MWRSCVELRGGGKVSKGIVCRCPQSELPIDAREWIIEQYQSSQSAFNGYRYCASDYSEISCSECNASWRTKANYVAHLRRRQ